MAVFDSNDSNETVFRWPAESRNIQLPYVDLVLLLLPITG
jgi:hypothetical protein